MLQSLLADRFKLVLHKDVRPVPAFALKLERDKPKIKVADGSGDAECKYQRQPDTSVYTVYSCRNMTMAGFARRLRDSCAQWRGTIWPIPWSMPPA
jgi:uncharacterized protein (TIGR03435 family)